MEISLNRDYSEAAHIGHHITKAMLKGGTVLKKHPTQGAQFSFKENLYNMLLYVCGVGMGTDRNCRSSCLLSKIKTAMESWKHIC